MLDAMTRPPDAAWSPPGWAWVLVAVAVVVPTLALAALHRRTRIRLARLTRASRRAAEAERRFATFADTVPLGLWQIHAQPGQRPEYVYVSEGILAIHGLPATATVDVETLHGRILPPGRQVFEELLVPRATRADEAPATLAFEYDIRRDDGSVAHLYSHGHPARQPDGSVLWNGYTQDLTEARQLRRAVESRTRQLQDLARNLPGTILQMVREPAGRLRLGPLFSDELKITGHRVADWPDPFEGLVRLIEPADHAAFWDNIERTRLAPGTFDFPLRLRRAEGGLVWVRLLGHSRHEPDGTVVWNGMALDTTALRRSELLLQDLTNGLPGVIWQLARDGERGLRFDFLSQGVREMLGLEVPPLMHDPRPAFAAVVDDDRPRVRAFIERLFAVPDTTGTLECRFTAADGRQISVQVQASSREGDTGRLVVNGVMLDITERVELAGRLKGAQAREQALLQQRADFLSQVSHEMRTPLNAIVAPLARLLDTETDASTPRARVLETALGQCQDMLRLLSDLMSATRAEQQRFDFVRQPFRLRALLAQLQRQTVDAARRARVTLTCTVVPGTPEWWQGDEFRVRQILDNLVANALKFTDPQGGVAVRLAHEGHTLEARVADTGVGMGQETLSRLFEPYYQGNNPEAPRKGGFGLGLAIVQRLVTEMGGTVSVDSQPGQGSVFTVRLALEPLSAGEHPLGATLAPPPRVAPPVAAAGAPTSDAAPQDRLAPVRAALARHDTQARRLLAGLAVQFPADPRLPAAQEALGQYDFDAAAEYLAATPSAFPGSAPEPAPSARDVAGVADEVVT